MCLKKESNLEITLAKDPQASRRFVLQARVFTLDPSVSLGFIFSRPKTLHYNPRPKYKVKRRPRLLDPLYKVKIRAWAYLSHMTPTLLECA